MKIGVVIPHYRDGSTLRRALDSVAAQTLPPDEVVVVDDASPESDYQLLEKIVGGYALPIRIIRLQENRGPGNARTVGWSALSSELVAFLDSDDSWLPNKLEVQSELLKEHGLDLLGGPNVWAVSGNAQAGGVGTLTVVSRRAIIARNRFSTSSVMVKRAVPLRFSTRRRYAEDYELWLRLALSGARLGRYGTALTVSYKRPFGESGLSAQVSKMTTSQLAVYRDAYKDGLLHWYEWVVATAWSLVRAFRRGVLTLYYRVRS